MTASNTLTMDSATPDVTTDVTTALCAQLTAGSQREACFPCCAPAMDVRCASPAPCVSTDIDSTSPTTSISTDCEIGCTTDAGPAPAHSGTLQTDPSFHLIVVGSGPHALTALLRLYHALVEDGNADIELSADEVSRRDYWRKRDPAMHAQHRARLAWVRELFQRIVVFDTSGKWMSRWSDSLAKCATKALRSPVSAHPDPVSADALVAFAHSTARQHEVVEAEGLWGRVAGPRARVAMRGPQARQCHKRYTYTPAEKTQLGIPSTQLFHDFCSNLLAQNPVVAGTIRKATVAAVAVEPSTGGASVTLADGTVLTSRAVLLAVGSQNVPVIPDWLTEVLSAHKAAARATKPSWFHVWQADASAITACTGDVAVIGSGLTAVQLAIRLAKQRGVRAVTLISRKPIRTQVFESSFQWFGTSGVSSMFEFRKRPPHERAELIREARSGGTVNPMFMTELKACVQAGRVTVHEDAQVHAAEWLPRDRVWKLAARGNDGVVISTISASTVVLATGSVVDVTADSLFNALVAATPASCVCSGLPVLAPGLRWPGTRNVFVTGAYAQLTLGPNSGNLFGARIAAAQLAVELQLVLPQAELRAASSVFHRTYSKAGANKFSALLCDSDDDGGSDKE